MILTKFIYYLTNFFSLTLFQADDKVNFHFILFNNVDGHLYELGMCRSILESSRISLLWIAPVCDFPSGSIYAMIYDAITVFHWEHLALCHTQLTLLRQLKCPVTSQ